MSVIEEFFTTQATPISYEATDDEGADTVTTGSRFMGLLRPIEDISSLYIENNIGKEFDFVTANTNRVSVNDTLLINSDEYKVLSVTSYSDLEDDSESHVYIRVSK